MHKIIDDLNWRYAAKAFDPSKRVSEEDLATLTEALRLTASSFGLQLWKFIVVENKEIQTKLKEVSWNQAQVEQASHVIVLCRNTDATEADIEKLIDFTASERSMNKEDLGGYAGMMKGFLSNMDERRKKEWLSDQVYIALGNLLTVCAHLRIDSCPMEGFDNKAYDEILNLKEYGASSVVVCPIGYRADDDKYATAKKLRYSKEELVHHIS